MKKKLAAILSLAMVVAVILSMTGCGSNGGTTAEASENNTMEFVVRSGNFDIYRHAETGVFYLWRRSGVGAVLTVMLNADGTPYTGGNEE